MFELNGWVYEYLCGSDDLESLEEIAKKYLENSKPPFCVEIRNREGAVVFRLEKQ